MQFKLIYYLYYYYLLLFSVSLILSSLMCNDSRYFSDLFSLNFTKVGVTRLHGMLCGMLLPHDARTAYHALELELVQIHVIALCAQLCCNALHHN